MGRRRVDKLVVERGLSPTREKARRMILAGDLLVDERPVDKPGALVPEEATLRLRNPPKPFVGRGGEKLAGALDAVALELDPAGLRVLDVGASTGGFTDCLLQRGAAAVTALDVGRGQLDWKLYSDPRVRAIEASNARYLRPEDFPEPFDLVTVDVSFISLAKVLPALVPLLRMEGRMLALVKPQFELGPDAVERGGLVRSAVRHLEALESSAEAARREGLELLEVVPSPITGASGNQEYFLFARRGGAPGRSPEQWTERARRACGLEVC
jgi:23S rRNA (cytidine1920-2'-O)/16S rRNA (cytidine1409-2'-O)-methyltransferase